MKARSVSEIAIQAEMDETGLNRLQAIRRIQSRAKMTRKAVSQAPDGAPLFFARPGERI